MVMFDGFPRTVIAGVVALFLFYFRLNWSCINVLLSILFLYAVSNYIFRGRFGAVGVTACV